MPATILADSNVFVAALTIGHPHEGPSRDLLNHPTVQIAIATHSLSEIYQHITKRKPPLFALAPTIAMGAIDALLSFCTQVSLTPDESLSAIRGFATRGGTGPRLYDWLIGEAAIHASIRTIVTWNTRDFLDLFPKLDIVDPIAYVARP